MVLILNGKLERVAHAKRRICLFEEKNRFFTALDQIKCLKLIK